MKRIRSRSSIKRRARRASSLEVWVANQQRRFKPSQTMARHWAQRILNLLGWRQATLSVLFVNPHQMQRLQQRYRGKNQPTDVLAFGQNEWWELPCSKRPFLGDVVLSIEAAKERAEEFGRRWDEELLLYLCHGILHLMGYRDSTLKEKRRMQAKENELLRNLLGPRWPSKKPKRIF